MTDAPTFAGIDIGKDELVLAFQHTRKVQTFRNDDAGRAKLIETLRTQAPQRIVFEATGGYERALVLDLLAAQLPLDLVNPRRARDYARSLGALAKTDAIDARMLAKFAAALKDEPRRVPDATVMQLQDLLVRREQLVTMRGVEKTRRQQVTPVVVPGIDRLITTLDHEIELIEDDLDRLIRETAQWHAREQVLREIDSIGPQTARVLIAFLPELGTISRSEIAALAGLAPLNCDSGQHRGQRHIYGGRARVRSALYMAALSATRKTSPFHAAYRRLRDAGKPAAVALVAIARRILLVANAVIKSGQPYDQKIVLGA